MAPTLAQQNKAHRAIDRRGHKRDREADAKFLERPRIGQTLDRGVDDEAGGDDDHHAFSPSG